MKKTKEQGEAPRPSSGAVRERVEEPFLVGVSLALLHRDQTALNEAKKVALDHFGLSKDDYYKLRVRSWRDYSSHRLMIEFARKEGNRK